MPSPVRIGSVRPGAAPGGGQTPQTYQGTRSGYGPTVGSSVGYDARNPYAYNASVGAKAYPNKAAVKPPAFKDNNGQDQN